MTAAAKIAKVLGLDIVLLLQRNGVEGCRLPSQRVVGGRQLAISNGLLQRSNRMGADTLLVPPDLDAVSVAPDIDAVLVPPDIDAIAAPPPD